MTKARQNLRAQQKERGFYKKKPHGRKHPTSEEKKKAIAAQKKKSRCGACGQIGHWAGDPECPKKSTKYDKRKGGSGGGGRSQGKKGGYSSRPRDRSQQSFFTIDDDHEAFNDRACMVEEIETQSVGSGGWQKIPPPPPYKASHEWLKSGKEAKSRGEPPTETMTGALTGAVRMVKIPKVDPASQGDWANPEEERKEIVRKALMELRTCKELKAELRDLGLPVSGLKADLVNRLWRATSGRN